MGDTYHNGTKIHKQTTHFIIDAFLILFNRHFYTPTWNPFIAHCLIEDWQPSKPTEKRNCEQWNNVLSSIFFQFIFAAWWKATENSRRESFQGKKVRKIKGKSDKKWEKYSNQAKQRRKNKQNRHRKPNNRNKSIEKCVKSRKQIDFWIWMKMAQCKCADFTLETVFCSSKANSALKSCAKRRYSC